MSETQDLDQILNGVVEPDAPTPEPVAEAAPAETADTAPRDEKGRFAPKGETEGEAPPVTEAAPPAASEVEGPTVPRKALQDERSKRQALEDRIQQLEAAQQQKPAEPPPSIWDDTPGWEQHFGQNVIQEAVSAASQNARLDMSEMMVRQAHPDFEDKKAAFIEAMQTTPGLQQRALQDPHPWAFAYQYVQNQERMQELSAVNVTDLEAKIRAEVMAELQAQAPGPKPAAGVPPSLSSERNVGSRAGPAWTGPASLGDILNRA